MEWNSILLISFHLLIMTTSEQHHLLISTIQILMTEYLLKMIINMSTHHPKDHPFIKTIWFWGSWLNCLDGLTCYDYSNYLYSVLSNWFSYIAFTLYDISTCLKNCDLRSWLHILVYNQIICDRICEGGYHSFSKVWLWPFNNFKTNQSIFLKLYQ